MAERTAPIGTDEQADGNTSVDPDPWPANTSFEADGMWMAGASAVVLAERFSTPLVVFDHDDLTARLRAAQLAFPKTFYAVKAFSAHAMLRLAVDEGLDLLAASGGEVEACVRAGVPPARVAFHGRNKSDDELALAVRVGVGLVIADGLDELRRLDAFAGAAGIVQPYLLRVNPGIRVDTHESIATGHESTAFGVPAAAVPETVAAAAPLAHLRFLGLHAHIGSQVLTTGPFLRELDVLVALTVKLREQHGIAVELARHGWGVRHHVHGRDAPFHHRDGGRRGAPPAHPLRRATGSPCRRWRPSPVGASRATPGSRSTGSATAGPWATVGP